MDYKARLKALRNELKKKELDGVIIDNPFNRRYLSGFTGSYGALFIDSKSAFIATDSRYYIQAKNQCPDFKLIPTENNSPYFQIMKNRKLEGKKIGFEAETVSVSNLKAIKKFLKGVKLIPTEQLVVLLRAVKADEEVNHILSAQKIADNCFKMLMNKLKPGMTEKSVAWMMEVFMRENGAEALSFDTIMASGPNSALPHAVPTDRKLKKNEPLLFDYGCMVNGYCSDMTRVLFMGKPTSKMEYVYNRVLEAHLMVYEMSQPEIPVADIDTISRDYIYKSKWNNSDLMGEKKGQGRYEHGLGHGVGLEVHEKPVLSRKLKNDKLKIGHIVTNEPGIYIEDEGGVRIEDIMHITSDGPVSLTKAPKELIIL